MEEDAMDWARAIDINRTALTRIVAMLITMVAGYETRVPRPIYHAVLRVLYPAESAVRRLIVIAARGLKVTVSPPRPLPQGLAFTGQRRETLTFSLCDPRRELPSPYLRRPSGLPEPRIRVLDASPLVPLFHRQSIESPVSPPETSISAQRLKRRLDAIKHALDTLPQQARRLARLQAKRKQSPHPPPRPLLRSGSPPGSRQKPTDEIDFILKECHGLARDALKEDTS
jgi:hypothetical protein